MRFSGHINYIKCMEYGLNLSQGAVMDVLCSVSTRATGKEIGGDIYYYLSSGKLVAELPIISEKKNTFIVILSKLIEKGLLERIYEHKKSYYKLTDEGKSFVRIDEKNHGHGGKKSSMIDEKNHHYNITNNNITNDKKNNIKNLEEDSNASDGKTNEQFELFWKSFPHVRTAKKKDALDFFKKCSYSFEEIMKEVDILKMRIKYELQDAKFVKGCALRMRDLTITNEVIFNNIAKEIAYKHRKNLPQRKDLDKLKIDVDEMYNIFGPDLIRKHTRAYVDEFESVKLNFTPA